MATTFEDFRNLSDIAFTKRKKHPSTLFGKLKYYDERDYYDFDEFGSFTDAYEFLKNAKDRYENEGDLFYDNHYDEFAKVENAYESICSLFEELLKIYTLYEINNKISKIGIDGLDWILYSIVNKYEREELPKIKEFLSKVWIEEPTQSPSFAILMDYLSGELSILKTMWGYDEDDELTEEDLQDHLRL